MSSRHGPGATSAATQVPKAPPAAIEDSFRVAIAAMLADPAYLAAKERVLGRYPRVGGATA